VAARAGRPDPGRLPPPHIRSSVEGILRQARLDSLDLVQFHVWQDDWADDDGWQRAAEKLKRDGLVRHVGISVNRREPENVLRTLRTGQVDAVQVVYNIFRPGPGGRALPTLSRAWRGRDSRGCPSTREAWPARSRSGKPLARGRLAEQLLRPGEPRGDDPRVEVIRSLVPEGQTMAQLALRFILSNPDVTTVIPACAASSTSAANLAASAAGPSRELVAALRAHRWDRAQSRGSDVVARAYLARCLTPLPSPTRRVWIRALLACGAIGPVVFWCSARRSPADVARVRRRDRLDQLDVHAPLVGCRCWRSRSARR